MNQRWFLQGSSPGSPSAGLTRTSKGTGRSVRWRLLSKAVAPGWHLISAILMSLGLGLVALFMILVVPAIVYLIVNPVSPVLALWMMFGTFVLLIFGFSRLL